MVVVGLHRDALRRVPPHYPGGAEGAHRVPGGSQAAGRRPDPIGGAEPWLGQRPRHSEAAPHHRCEADPGAPQAIVLLLLHPIRLQVRAGPGSAVVPDLGTVLPIKVHRKMETGESLNLVMAWAEKGSEQTVDVPVVFKGEDVCRGLKGLSAQDKDQPKIPLPNRTHSSKN
ncbi:hypothetical protein COCNU_06G017520 [Cocos nucifera]|uniref:Uncharacterized protein n=1 Tax=Cocos nucifera TaxID=13894 RepID=A0A8K0ICS1_COCNU|nr:hypothetical protein COCNU_06G017520 [Cocos nucifera]